MKLSTLDAKHPSYDAERWCELDALAKGGKAFKARIQKFLPQNPVEPDDMYVQRRSQAHYRSYIGAIVNLYVSWLFAASFSIKAYKRGTEEAIADVSPFYGQFQEDVGAETQLKAFMEERSRAALTNQTAAWLIELPSNDGQAPTTQAEYESRELGRASLKAIDNCDLFDWEEDDKGNLLWASVHTCQDVRGSWSAERNTTVEIWRIYDPESVHTFQLKYEKGKRPRDPNFEIPALGEPAPHGFKRVPIVRLSVPQELCIGEATYDTQLEHFRLENALSWLIRRTCYAQPVFNLEDGENTPPRMGTGYAIVLGKDDKMGWTAPPQAPFDVLQKNIDSKREELYRIVHQMAQAVDNNAETVGRSADSKEIDAAATRIILNAYGELVSKPIEETFEIISEARGESDYEWSVEGFSGYDTATVGSLLANASMARSLGIPSKAFHRELCTKTALALLPEADQRVKEKIRQEITEANFQVSSTPSDDQTDAMTAQAELDRAKAASEPIKAKASLRSASQPKTAPGVTAPPRK